MTGVDKACGSALLGLIDTATPGPHDGGALVGVLALGVPMHVNVLTNVFPWLEPYQQSLELSRLVLLDAPAAPALGTVRLSQSLPYLSCGRCADGPPPALG